MGSVKLVGIGLFILFTLPALVAASDRRHAHDLFHGILASAGIVWAWYAGGWHGLLLALASGVLILVLLASTVALTQRQWRRRALTGGEIKFVTASAIWLPPAQALVAIIVASLAITVWIFFNGAAAARVSRPAITPFVVISVIFIGYFSQ
jgi:Flp pilus assembly protein protease CpaA